MSSNLIAQSKLQFYPTSPVETYRMLPFFGFLNIPKFKEDILKKNVLGEELYRQIYVNVLDNESSSVYGIYDYLIKNNERDLIKEYFEWRGFSNKEGQNDRQYVIADLMAGEGDWLETFKTVIPCDQNNNIILLANEIEENRYNKIKEKEIVNYTYNQAFEDLQLPKYCISLLLYNPPYNESNNERNCHRYLQMILDRELLYKNMDKYNKETGSIIMVIREDDVLDCSDILSKYFSITRMYKVHNEEFDKWKQWVIYAQLRYEPLNETNTYDAFSLQEWNDKLYKTIESQIEFNIGMYSTWGNTVRLYPLKLNECMENFQIVRDNNKYISNNDNVWKWIKDISEIKDYSTESLIVPKPLKQGEIANLISAGYINGEIKLENDKGNHIVVGGTKNMIKTEKRKEKDDDGNSYDITEEIRYSQPYLNILCNKDGKMQIIELGGDE